jgi:hypothetical protein
MPVRVYQQQTTPSMIGAPRASAPALVDPTGAALSQLGATVEKIGQDMFARQREADLQDRIGKATAEISELELQFDRDQDFRTAPQRFQDQADAIRDKYLDGVEDGAVATAFRKQYQQLSLAKSINVRKAAWRKEADYTVASLDANLDTYATAAANAKNPAEAALVENQARLALASAQNGGWISAEDAGKKERGFLSKRDSAVVIRDLSLDPALTAAKLSLDPAYAPNIDPVQRERWVDQAFRRADANTKAADAAAERERKRRGDELLKEALGRQDKGQLTRGYVEEIKPFVEPAEYSSLLDGLNGKDRKDDPSAFAEVQGLVYTNPSMAERRAFALHRQGLIRNETLSSVLSRAREISRTEGPRTPYERERQFITDTLKPSPLVNDPAGSARFALAVREYDDFALSGDRAPKELRDKAEEIQRRFALVDMAELARKTSAGAQPTPEQQLKSIAEEATKLLADKEAKKVSDADFNRRMSNLNKARIAAEKALRTNGGK